MASKRAYIVVVALAVVMAIAPLAFPCVLEGLQSLNNDTPISLSTALFSGMASFGGVTVSVYFLTEPGQLVGGSRYLPSKLHSYRDAWTLLILLVACLIAGIAYFLTQIESLQSYSSVFLYYQTVLSVSTVLMIIPLSLSRLENMDPATVAQKVVRSIKTKSIHEYGLIDKADNGALQLKTYGNNYGKPDPLAPYHEVIKLAVENKDRLSLGNLVGLLLDRALHEWDIVPSRGSKADPLKDGYRLASCRHWLHERLRRCQEQREQKENGDTVTLHFLHYVVRRANNLLVEWPDRNDLGRTCCQSPLISFCAALSLTKGAECSISYTLCAIHRISLAYADRSPVTLVEPLNDLVACANILEEREYLAQANLAAQVLGSIKSQTGQLDDSRSAQVLSSLSVNLCSSFEKAREASVGNPAWSPFDDEQDPWRNIPNAILNEERPISDEQTI